MLLLMKSESGSRSSACRHAAVGEGVVRIEGDRLLEVADPSPQPVARPLVQAVPAAKVEMVRSGALGVALRQLPPLIPAQPQSQLFADLVRDLLLQREDV